MVAATHDARPRPLASRSSAACAAVSTMMTRSTVRLVAAAFGILLSHSQDDRVEATETAKPSIYGMTKEQLLACMGKPNVRVMTGNEELWTYVTYSKSGGTDCSTTLRFINGHLESVQSHNLVTDDRICEGVFGRKCIP